MNLTLHEIARALGGEVVGIQVLAPAPGHSQKDRGLGVKLSPSAPDGFVVHLFNGGDPIAAKDYVRQKLGIEPFKRKTARTTSYDYRDASGVVRYRKERYERSDGTKTFAFKQPNGTKGLGGAGHLLYGGERLADLGEGQPVWIVEGEKKVDRMRGLGATAVSGDCGAQSKWLPQHAELLRGLPVILWPDSDEPGETYIAAAAAAIRAVDPGADIRVVAPFPIDGAKGRDVCDWRGDAGTLAELAASAIAYGPDPKPKPAGNGDGRAPASILRIIEEFEMERVDWLWKNWLALGKLHLIAGAPETGKTTIGLAAIATLSSGGTWPDGTQTKPVNCLLWTGEDKIADTIKPRLARMGADMKRIYVVTGHPGHDGKPRPFCPASDMPGLEAAASAIPGGAAFLMLDPVVAAITRTANSHNNAETRNSLQPVVDFAERANCAVLGVTHFTKGTSGNDPVERVTGSLAFGALPRIVMAAAKRRNHDSDLAAPRILVLAKSNLGPSGGGFGYDIDAAPLYDRPDIIATRIAWQGILEGTARELIAEAEDEPASGKDKPSKFTEAKRLLEAMLANGSRPQREIEAAATSEGIGERTLWAASKELGIHKTKNGFGGWSWALT